MWFGFVSRLSLCFVTPFVNRSSQQRVRSTSSTFKQQDDAALTTTIRPSLKSLQPLCDCADPVVTWSSWILVSGDSSAQEWGRRTKLASVTSWQGGVGAPAWVWLGSMDRKHLSLCSLANEGDSSALAHWSCSPLQVCAIAPLVRGRQVFAAKLQRG